MITVPKLIDSLKAFVNMQLAEVTKASPIMSFTEPLIRRVLDNGINKADKLLYLIADSEGNIDVNEILNEMTSKLMETQPFVVHTSYIGDIIIGGGNIKVNIPYVNKDLVFSTEDLQKLKEVLTNKN